MATYKDLMHILKSSKEFWFDGEVLTVRGYYNGVEIKLDLGRLDEETFDELVVEDGGDDIEDDYYQ